MVACHNGNIETVKLLLAFGRRIDLDLEMSKDWEYEGVDYNAGLKAIDIAKVRGEENLVNLLEEFRKNPLSVKDSLMEELGLSGKPWKQKNTKNTKHTQHTTHNTQHTTQHNTQHNKQHNTTQHTTQHTQHNKQHKTTKENKETQKTKNIKT